jgi:hypothetical protein
MKVEQTSELIKAPNSTIQRLVNAIVDAMKINSQEIARPSVVPRRIYANIWNWRSFLQFFSNFIPKHVLSFMNRKSSCGYTTHFFRIKSFFFGKKPLFVQKIDSFFFENNPFITYLNKSKKRKNPKIPQGEVF